jgi:hypothetical protein
VEARAPFPGYASTARFLHSRDQRRRHPLVHLPHHGSRPPRACANHSSLRISVSSVISSPSHPLAAPRALAPKKKEVFSQLTWKRVSDSVFSSAIFKWQAWTGRRLIDFQWGIQQLAGNSGWDILTRYYPGNSYRPPRILFFHN